MRTLLLLLAMGCGSSPPPAEDVHTWTEAHAQLDEHVMERLPGFELSMSAAWVGLSTLVEVSLPEDAPVGADIIFYVTHQGVDEVCAPRRRGCIQLRYPIGWAARQVMSGGRTGGAVHFTVPEFLEDGEVLSVQAVLEHGDRVYTSPVVQRVIGDGDGDGAADEALITRR